MEKIMFSSVPCCYFPTETVLVYDNQVFLNNLKLELGENTKTVAFTNPKEALTYLKQKSSSAQEFIQRYVEESIDYSESSLKKGQLVHLSDLYQEVYNGDRFKMTSVAVVDFAMPQLNGRDFAQSLENSPYKILMLTGEADNNIAVELFNKGLIHKFILKAQKNYLEEMTKSIDELKTKYFLSLSNTLLASLGKDITSILADPAYVSKYDEIFKTHDIVESYLLDDFGSQLLLNEKGKPFWFFVKTEEGMQMLEDFVNDSRDSPVSLRDAIKNKKKLTYFFNVKESEIPETWPLYDVEITQGNQTYYFAFAENIENSPLDSQKIVSYTQYLRQNDKI